MQAAAGSDFHTDAGDSLTIVLEITESGPEFVDLLILRVCDREISVGNRGDLEPTIAI